MPKKRVKPYIIWLIWFRNGFVAVTALFGILWLFDALKRPIINIESDAFEPLLTVLGIIFISSLNWVIDNSATFEKALTKIRLGLESNKLVVVLSTMVCVIGLIFLLVRKPSTVDSHLKVDR